MNESPWIACKDQMPTEERLYVVESPFGIDMALWKRCRWWLKDGDDWHDQNLEEWTTNQPTRYTAFPLPPEPAKPDPFEAWYAQHDPRTPQSPFDKEHARAAWKAALASVQHKP